METDNEKNESDEEDNERGNPGNDDEVKVTEMMMMVITRDLLIY